MEKIYFDMDGVLVDFDRGVSELCGLEPIPQENHNSPKAHDEMWKRIRETEHFYDKLMPMKGAVEMFCAVYDEYADRCEILTGIPKPNKGVVTASEDKLNWTRRFLPEGVKVNLVYRAEKRNFCRGSGYVLIDDLKSTIDAWNSLGGIGILHHDCESTLKLLREMNILSK